MAGTSVIFNVCAVNFYVLNGCSRCFRSKNSVRSPTNINASILHFEVLYSSFNFAKKTCLLSATVKAINCMAVTVEYTREFAA